MKYLNIILLISLVLSLMACSKNDTLISSPPVIEKETLKSQNSTMDSTIPASESSPIATHEGALPTQMVMMASETYPSPTINADSTPYPQPLNPENSQSYPQPLNTENPQPYPQPSPGGILQTQPTVTPFITVTQGASQPLIGTVQSSSNQATLSIVDVSLHTTDPSTVQLASGGYQLIEFFAFWCPTCKSMAPVMNFLEKKYSSKVRFVFLDIDDPRTAKFKQGLGYQYQPHIFLIDGSGKIIKQWIGGVDQEELENTLNTIQ